MAIISPARRHLSLLLLRHRRAFSSDAAAAAPISAAAASARLRYEFDPDKAVSILSSVADPSASPSDGTSAVSLAVRRLAKSRRFAEIEPLIESLKNGPHAAHEPFLATLILSYGDARLIDQALRTFHDVARLTGSPPTAVSFNAVLSACLRGNRPRRVPELFAELSKKHSIAPTPVSYGILIKSLCIRGKSEKALETLSVIEPNTIMYTTLFDRLYKEGKTEEAEKLWKEMTIKGLAPDVAAYNVKIKHHALQGKPEVVLELIAEMESVGLKPNTITSNFLITAYCKNGRFEDAKAVYEELKGKDAGGGVSAATFKNFLSLLCASGDFDLGLEVYKESEKRNMVPDFRTMSALVSGLVKGSRVDEAKVVINDVKKKFPENLVKGWKKLEKELGLNGDGSQVADQTVAA